MDMTIGERIRKARKQHLMTQADLAESIGVHEITVRRWELGERPPNVGALQKIANVLSVPLIELTGDAPPETPQISLPINNMEKENKISNDDLDLGFWGSVVERAERAARSGDKQKLAAISLMLRMAENAITSAEGKQITEKRGTNIHADIIDNSGNVKQTISTAT